LKVRNYHGNIEINEGINFYIKMSAETLIYTNFVVAEHEGSTLMTPFAAEYRNGTACPLCYTSLITS